MPRMIDRRNIQRVMINVSSGFRETLLMIHIESCTNAPLIMSMLDGMIGVANISHPLLCNKKLGNVLLTHG